MVVPSLMGGKEEQDKWGFSGWGEMKTVGWDIQDSRFPLASM